MTLKSRFSVGWLPLLTLAAIVPAALYTSTASAEARKFVVLLTDLPKDHPGAPLVLPNVNEVWDAYFDHFKNGQTGIVRVDSFSEWWEEVSYGIVTVSGNVFGWTSMPWPSRPTGFDGNTDFGGTGAIAHVELQGGFDYTPGSGEGFSPINSEFMMDFDGVGDDPFLGNGPPRFVLLPPQVDEFGLPFWSPGPRFRDLNDNLVYDAGVPEMGIDKNGNGQIDVNRQAGSWGELLASTWDCTDPQNPVWTGWANNTEWVDSNFDGEWNADGGAGPWRLVGGATTDTHGNPAIIFRGDWGGSEVWVDRNGNGRLGNAAMRQGGDQDTPTQLYDLMVTFANCNANNNDQTEWWDQQTNHIYDYPEPFEGFLRAWDPGAHDWLPVSDDYIRANYPSTTVEDLITRLHGTRYFPPTAWSNANGATGTNKRQLVFGILRDQIEAGEQGRLNGFVTGSADRAASEGTLEPAWFREFWATWFGSEPPRWDDFPIIPYLRRIDPTIPIPQLAGQGTQPVMKWEPNHGGPLGDGHLPRGVTQTGTVQPNYADPTIGWYDGEAEYVDLPSSIYHAGGDQDMGEITSPATNDRWGEDVGPNRPDSPTPDGIIEAGGPLAFNVHGDGGFDGGNVLTTEFLTWRTDGESLTDFTIFDDQGFPVAKIYHRDTNLDGLIDTGETPGMASEFGRPWATKLYNYGVDANPGTPPNGGPSSEYPFNRHRLLEDAVAAVDDSVDWDDFLGGPPPFGNVISGLILCPAGTAIGMFALPAPSFNYPIHTRDHILEGAQGIDRYDPIVFFDGLGNGLNDGSGEGHAFNVGSFHTPFAAHEYGHSWEGFPDLYDYDVYRTGFSGRIINNPICGFCVMAGGGLVHPVPILKQDSHWMEATDITRLLVPAGNSTVEFRSWEFDRDRTVFVYRNPIFDGEEFWIWRNSIGNIDPATGQLVVNPDGSTQQAFDIFQPGQGLLIMHVDRSSDPEGLPIQQRLGTHFVYSIVQADGLQDLENGRNCGDAGDPFPGSSGRTTWDRTTDPSNRWYSGQSSGLDFRNIQQLDNSTRVTVHWSPRELPTFEWVQPPGGVSVNSIYQLKALLYDEFGGTTIQFFAFKNIPGQPLSWDQGIALGTMHKAPGEVDGVFNANVSTFEDGTYTFYAKLIPGRGADNRLENSWSVPRGNIDNVGNGDLTVNSVDPDTSKLERWTVTCTNPLPPGSETWRVEGSLSGLQSNTATTGQVYQSDADEFGRSALQFAISNGSVPFRLGDSFVFLTTGLTPHSAAVLVQNGQVVTPVPPIARARTENNVVNGLAPLTVVFHHDGSSDPRGASLTFRWDFGDGSPTFTTTDLNRPVSHTYTAPRSTPYQALLTVTNAFNLTDTDEIDITVNEARRPTVRVTTDPNPPIGAAPLAVTFNGDQTSDPNEGTQRLDFVWNFGDGSPVVTTANASHTFTRVGIFQATLTVTNRPYGKSATKTVEIRATGPAADQPPVAAVRVDKTSGVAPLVVKFDGRGSFDPENAELRYDWDFDDGSAHASTAQVEHRFTQTGTHFVMLTVSDPSGQTDTAVEAIVVTGDQSSSNSSPLARIQASATQGAAPFTVEFDASSSSDPENGPMSFAWTFGDGSPQAEGEKVRHTFTEARDYTVRLVARDSQDGRGEASIVISVTSPAGGDSGRPTPNDNSSTPDVGAAGCGSTGGACAPVGLMPAMLTLLGIGGLRRWKFRR